MNYIIIDGVMLPIAGGMPLSDLEVPARILGALAAVGLLSVAVWIVWNLPVVPV